VKAHIHRTSLDDVNRVFENLKAGLVDGRMVLDMGVAVTPTVSRRVTVKV
jgi:D-arabinose 1-dehydrogenase-like Zn-dependent alcohol dehydrogenase